MMVDNWGEKTPSKRIGPMRLAECWRDKGNLEEIIQFMNEHYLNFLVLGRPWISPGDTFKLLSIVFNLRSESSNPAR